MPWFEFIGTALTIFIFRLLDSGKIFGTRTTTKCVTQKQYIDLYSGPVYLMHYKYASIIMMINITFMFGMFIPILWFITLIGIINFHLAERLLLAYWYRQPPMFDGTLHQYSLNILSFAPLYMFAFGYWAMGNRSIFYYDRIDFKT
jgi:hypothetical protein